MTDPTPFAPPEPVAALLSRTVAELAERDGVVAIELVGSLARGQFRAGSDLDFQVILDHEPESDESWVFDPSGIAVNAHYCSLESVVSLEGASSEVFGEAIRAEWLPDRLTGSRALWARDDALGAGWGTVRDRLVARRHDPAERPRIVSAFRDHARALVETGREHLRWGAPLDGWQCARDAMGTLAHGEFVGAGRIIRGLKRTPELLRELGRADLADALMSTVGGPLPTAELLDLAGRRTRFRDASAGYVAALAAGDAAGHRVETQRWQEHATNSVDYYRSLIDDGYGDGMLNHLRTLSGAVKLPATALALLGTTAEAPYTAWVGLAPEGLRAEWAVLLGFPSDDGQVGAGRALELADAFARE